MMHPLGDTTQHQEFIRQVFDQSPDPYWIIDPGTSAFLYANHESEKQLGFSLAEIVQRKLGVVDVNLVVSTPEKWREVTAGLQPGQTLRYLADLRCKSGDSVRVEITLSQMVLDGRPVYFAVTRDVSHIVAIEAKLREREALLHAVFETMTEGVLVTDGSNRCLLSNRRINELLGFDARTASHSDLAIAFDSLHATEPSAASPGGFLSVLHGQRAVSDLLLKTRVPSGQVHWLVANAQPLTSASLQGAVLTLTDVSEVKRTQARVDYMSATDLLTDLPNRGRLLAELAKQLHGCLDDGGWVALLVLDVDRFKVVNETHGHSAGDDLLLRLSDRLRTLLPQGGLLARLSADEFGLLLHLDAASFKHARAAAEAFAARLCEAARRPFVTRYEPYETTASVGIVLSEGSNVNAETVLQYAGLALALAKEGGGDGWRLFDPALLESSKSRYYAESALRDGLRAAEFELYFQPKVDMASGEVRGAEALIRWNRLGQGTLGADRIVPVAERSTLILSLGEWVMREACRCVQRLIDEGLMAQLGTLSVNVSPRQFQQSDFVSRTRGLMLEMSAEPRHLCLELTETALASDTEHVVASLQLLKAEGFGIAIDDFGTGYSSFAYLQRFPVDELKIDKTFVDEIERSERSLAIVRAMLAMAQVLRLSVVAEGIETEAQRALLGASGCAAGQGYLFARPMPLEALIGWLRQRQPAPSAQATLAPVP